MTAPEQSNRGAPSPERPPLEAPLTGGGRTAVARRGDVVVREAGPWSATVHQLLRHLEGAGFAGAPRVAGSGFDERGRETLTYIDGDVVHPGPWPDDALPVLGRMLRQFHDATASFPVPTDAVWQHSFPRDLGGPKPIIGHCDVAPWNIVARNGLPVGLIDWEYAGPIDRRVELAQACWLNAQLHDDDVAARVGLPPPADRARQMRSLLDGYGLPRADRAGFVDALVEYAVHAAAWEAIEADVTPASRDLKPLWGLAWRTRAAAWMLRHRPTLEQALA